MDAKGHAALVTGGASGLGAATAKALAAAGAKVAVLDIDGAQQVFALDAALHPGSWSRGDLLLARHAVP